MRAVFFTCLLVVAGVSAMPKDIAPAQGRLMDMVIRSGVQQVIEFMVNNGMDPMVIEHHVFDDTMIQGMVYVKGTVEDFVMIGASGLTLDEVLFNIIVGNLHVNLNVDKVSITVGRYAAEGRFGDSGGRGELSGSLEIANLRFKVDTLLTFIPGWPVTIHNIVAAVTLGHIKSDFKASFECLGCLQPRDVSCCVNSFFNKRIPDAMVTYKTYINIAVAEGIRHMVNRPRI